MSFLGLSRRGRIFRRRLEEVMALPEERGRKAPSVVEHSLRYLLVFGKETEGIMRLSADKSIVLELKKLYDEKRVAEWTDSRLYERLCELAKGNVHAVAELLKLYLRSLPEPLMTWGFYRPLIKSSSLENSELVQAQLIKVLFDSLPEVNQSLICLVIKSFMQLLKFSEKNKMTMYSLAVVLSQNVLASSYDVDKKLRTTSSEQKKLLLEETALAVKVVLSLMKYHENIFDQRPFDVLFSERDLAQWLSWPPQFASEEQAKNFSSFIALVQRNRELVPLNSPTVSVKETDVNEKNEKEYTMDAQLRISQTVEQIPTSTSQDLYTYVHSSNLRARSHSDSILL